ncbi:deoxyribose-phosphate aldolase, partial [Kineococcus auxinigenes]|uniref:deoxyribose-phosphate aldolase n=1 Tax=Kineococcus sp. SYSU DK033 TaxID=3383154 RepID=UPI003D7C65BA
EAVEGLVVATVCGYPTGNHPTPLKAAEAEAAVRAGAHEVDMVIDVGAALAGEFDAVRADVAAVRAAVPSPGVLKVIVESAALPDDVLVEVCRAAETAGADFVKTSTGFHSTGGASVHAVQLMAATVGGRLGVKASGGIRDTASALAVLDAGATRLGLSGTAAVLAGLDG